MKRSKSPVFWFGLSVAAGCAAAIAQSPGSAATALTIRAQPLEKAIGEWSEQTGYQVLLQADGSNWVVSQDLDGVFTPEGALKVLLAGTSFEYERINARTVAIRSRESRDEHAPSGGGGDAPTDTLAQVIVTAQKHEERLVDVPVPVSVISADKLADANQLKVEDYYASIPGVNVAPTGAQSLQISIRGLSSGSWLSNPSVGVAIDDIPYGSSILWGGGASVPDVDPGDLARIEVLRGPQGTLYGTSSLGGLLKFVTVDPSTDKFSGRIQIGGNTVAGGSNAGYSARGSANIPLSDTFAIRASGYTRMDPGYIDDVLTGKRDVNETRGTGGRVSSLWKITDALTLKLSALVQRTETKGSPVMDPSLGDLKQSTSLGSGQFTKDINAFSATLQAQLGAAELTSLTGYNVFRNSGSEDTFGLLYKQDYKSEKLSQELRLRMPIGSRVDWLVGAFFTREDPDVLTEDLLVVDPLTGEPVPSPTVLFHSISPATHREYAAFTNLTFDLTDRFDVQVGGRYAHFEQEFTPDLLGDLTVSFTGEYHYVPPPVSPRDSSFTYLVTPRFRISPDLMVYARLASGYRTGGPNASLVPVTLPIMKPDKTENYELGLKGTFLRGELTVDASVYYIDWKDMQVNGVLTLHTANGDVGASAYVNADSAKSQGLEVSVELRPTKGFRLGLWGSWNTAVLTADIPPDILLEGNSGNRLPMGARFSGHLDVQQEFPLGANLSGFVGGSFSYVGNRMSEFVARDSGTPRGTLPGYAKTDVVAGVRFDTWDFSLFCNNLLDRRGLLTNDPLSGGVLAIQTRSIGVSVLKTF